MKYLCCLMLLLVFIGCCQDDCYDGGTFRFRLLDENGKNISFDSLVMKDPTAMRDLELDADYSDSCLVNSLGPTSARTYKLIYKGQSTDLNVSVQKTGEDRCCGDHLEASEVISPKGKATIETTRAGEPIFVITL